jgi:hypothetical protein
MSASGLGKSDVEKRHLIGSSRPTDRCWIMLKVNRHVETDSSSRTRTKKLPINRCQIVPSLTRHANQCGSERLFFVTGPPDGITTTVLRLARRSGSA